MLSHRLLIDFKIDLFIKCNSCQGLYYPNQMRGEICLCCVNAALESKRSKKKEARKLRRKEKKKNKKIAKRLNPKFYNSQEWRELRYEALKRYGTACSCCGASRQSVAVMHVDHIKPRSKYPELELDINNLQILCQDCNLGKVNKDEIK